MSQEDYFMTYEKINQNTASINNQNTSFYVHHWRLPKEVKQKTVSASVVGCRVLLKVGRIRSSWGGKNTMVHACVVDTFI